MPKRSPRLDDVPEMSSLAGLAKPRGARRLTKRDAVAATLRNEIMRGALPAGTKLLQLAVAARLGVSPTPVREAFSELALEGYVEWDAFRGVRVSDRGGDPLGLMDVYQLRGDLEILATRRGVRSLRLEVIRPLEDAERDAREAERSGDTERWQLANSRFHAGLVAMAGSPLLDQMMGFVLRRSLFNPTLMSPRIHREHRAIVAALKAGDSRRAVRLVGQHARANVGAAKRREPRRLGNGAPENRDRPTKGRRQHSADEQ